MKIGIIISSEGSAFMTAFKILNKFMSHKVFFIIISIRRKNLIEFCLENQIEYILIDEPDNKIFSKIAKQELEIRSISIIFFILFKNIIERSIFKFFNY